MADENLKQAIEFVHNGKIKEARELFESILKTNPQNIPAWFWYVETFPTAAQRMQILEACLRFNPTNTQAKQALAGLSHPKEKITPPQFEVKPRTVVANPVSTPRQVDVTPAKVSSLQGKPANEQPVASQPQPAVPAKPRGSHLSALFMWGTAILFLAFFGVIGVMAFSSNSFSIAKDPSQYRHEQPIEYYLYAPKNYSSDRAWPLFVGIHGSGGSGLDCWNWWQFYADKEGFILLCPSIADQGGGWYQTDGETKVFSAINQARSEYHLEPREFIAGFSAGAQFVQGFAFKYPQYVSGVAVLSAGNYYIPTLGAQGVPFLVVIGDQDDPVSIQGSESFAATLSQNGFIVQYQVLPGVGHILTDQAKQLTIDLFRKTEGK